MGTKLLSRLAPVAVPVIALCLAAGAGAASVTLPEAVNLAFQRNAQYQLDVWEHELTLEEQRLKDQKLTLSFSSTPFQLKDGGFQPAKGRVTLTAPLGDHMTFTGNVAVQSQESVYTGALNITLKYDFFAAPAAAHTSKTESMLPVDNALVMNVTTTMVNLAKERNKLVLEELRLAYLQEAHQAAVVTDNQAQISQLKQQVYESEKRLASLQTTVRQYNQQLNRLLNTEAQIDFEPSIILKVFALEYEESQLMESAMKASSQRSQAAAAVEQAEKQLEATKKSSGWSISADASFDWNSAVSQSPTWSVSLTASRALYPPSLQAEKDALKLARAELQLAEVELSIRSQVSQLWEKLTSLEAQRQDLEEDLQAEEAELEAKRRLYEAGLTTELKLKEHQLELARLKNNLVENQYDYLVALLQLFDLCGFELSALIPDLVD